VPRCALGAIIVNAASHLTEFDQAAKLAAWRERQGLAVIHSSRFDSYSQLLRGDLLNTR